MVIGDTGVDMEATILELNMVGTRNITTTINSVDALFLFVEAAKPAMTVG